MMCDTESKTADQESISSAERSPAKVLCSLRIVAVASDHYLGRRYVMEIASSARSKELRVYRTLHQLMDAVSKLGLHTELISALYRDLCDEGSCTHLDIVI